ncbi:MAG TPA: divergent polysaccharide deacetylase family protein [Thermoanaerobaculia bacterium]|nr:divergent polysaccharide deacetylase family protein [Thermoanaerobaculia bacterium]
MRRPPHRARGIGWGGVGLFLLGVATGAGGSYFGCHDSAGRPEGGEPARAAATGAMGEHRQGQRDGSAAGAARKPASGRQPGASSVAATSARRAGWAKGMGRETETGPGSDQAGPAGQPVPRLPPQATRIALVIDDLGRSLGDLDTLARLGIPLTYAVLPFESQTSEVAATLRQRGAEILCHLPMEPGNGGNPGPGALRLGMSSEQLRASTLAAIAAVPGAVGVNNHMGSGLSADAPSMGTILGVLAARRLYFLDSRTSANSVGFQLAAGLGIPAAERQVFLDDDQQPEAVAAQFDRLLEIARTRGEAIAIGHPHPATLATLAAAVPRARALGYRFVEVSSLLDRPPGRAAP